MKYYSRKSAQEAAIAINGFEMNSHDNQTKRKVLKVTFSKSRKSQHDFPLNLDKSIELAK